jgi:tetratricopeptide (TPR) repeat protein
VFAWHLGQAEVALSAGRPAPAAFHLDQVRNREPPDLVSCQRRGQLFVRAGAWERAAADFARVFADHDPDDPNAWLGYAWALVLRGDAESYRRLCARLLAHAGQNDPAYLASDAARVCGLASGASADPEEVACRAEVIRYFSSSQAGILYVVGLAHYRAGDWEDALLRVEESVAAAPREAWQCRPLLALIHQKLGHAEEARRQLEEAAAWRRQEKQRAQEWAGFAPTGEWPEFEILYIEADAAIHGGKP